MHLGAGDGFNMTADGHLMYGFGFNDLTGIPTAGPSAIDVLSKGILAANLPAPTIVVDQDDIFYLTLTNVGMLMRPDLFDAHSIHWHGFPNAASVFDGLPEASVTINEGSSFTYYYMVATEGTYMYHCHVEATEHIQMGMVGNLWVRPRQNGTPLGSCAGGTPCVKFAYNDGDGSTGYDIEYPVQLFSYDSNFHDLHIGIQPLPFAYMRDDYALFNGRGYPDTVNPSALPAPIDPGTGDPANATPEHPAGVQSQKISSLITATAGQKILLRLSNLSVTKLYTVTALGLPMQVVGHDARILRSSTGANTYYNTSSLTLGGGQSYDVIVNTAGVAPGRYFLYTTNLNYLSNNADDFGGMMTEIVVN